MNKDYVGAEDYKYDMKKNFVKTSFWYFDLLIFVDNICAYKDEVTYYFICVNRSRQLFHLLQFFTLTDGTVKIQNVILGKGFLNKKSVLA